MLRSSNEELWGEVANAYEAIEVTQQSAAEPPASAHLAELAERLSEAKI